MKVRQLYTSCLSEAAYFIRSEDECAIIDPLRDVDKYIQLAKEENCKIKYVFETHFHADFVSGHIDLGQKTNAPIIYGPGANPSYQIHEAKDGERFQIGKCSIEVIHTPGHTLESSCFLLRNENDVPHCIFTGDTLFIGDVGRPDLMGGVATKEELAAKLYESLQNRILPLPDDLIVYPGHGAGSSCGKALSSNTYSTLGEQKQNNYALQPQTKEAFILAVTNGLKTPPKYFPINAAINREGYENFDELMKMSVKPLDVKSFEKAAKNGAIILDTRSSEIFSTYFIKGSINIGLEGRFAEWAGMLIDFDTKVILVTQKGQEKESIIRMSRVGFENVIGYLDGGFETWQKAGKPTDMLISIEADELFIDQKYDKEIAIIDVRDQSEFEENHIENAINIQLKDLENEMEILNLDDKLYIHCLTGYRSVTACSILKKHGFQKIRNVSGGFEAIRSLNFELASKKLKSVSAN